MTITAKNLIQAKYAGVAATTEYTAPVLTRTLIDKFTATNTDASARTLTINIVPSGAGVALSNTVTSALSIAAGASVTIPEMQNQILEAGDFISCTASVASKVVIRMSGREVVT